MNLHLRPPDLPMTSRAAEGLERRLWTVAEIEAMVQAGIIDEHERFELIDGEVVPMSPKGARHEMIKASLNDYVVPNLPKTVKLIPETTLRLDKKSFLEPDFVFFRRETGVAKIGPDNILLAIEVADTSLRFDLGRKAAIYAKYGVSDLWVINAEKLETHAFSKPSADGYLERRLIEPTMQLPFTFAPLLHLKLSELPLL